MKSEGKTVTMRENRATGGANSITGTEIKFHRCFVRFARGKKKGRGGREESPSVLNFVCFFQRHGERRNYFKKIVKFV